MHVIVLCKLEITTQRMLLLTLWEIDEDNQYPVRLMLIHAKHASLPSSLLHPPAHVLLRVV